MSPIIREIHWQSVFDSGKQFVYLEATEGETYQRPSYVQHVESLTKRGALSGSCHFFEPSVTGAVDLNFISGTGYLLHSLRCH